MILLTTDSFGSFGKFEGEYDIVTDPHVPPAVHAPRKCPVHTQIHIKKELNLLLNREGHFHPHRLETCSDKGGMFP